MTEQLLSFLLIGSSVSEWKSILSSAIHGLGSVQTVEPNVLATRSLPEESTLFIIDATYTENVTAMINHIRSQYPQARVLVVTSSPSWSRARDAFKAGAVDYIKKSVDAESVRYSVQMALQKEVPAVRFEQQMKVAR